MTTGRDCFSWESGFALSEVTFLNHNLVDKQDSAMKGRGKSIPGSENGRCKGPEVGACLVYLRIKKASRAGVGLARGRGREMPSERRTGARSGRPC